MSTSGKNKLIIVFNYGILAILDRYQLAEIGSVRQEIHQKGVVAGADLVGELGECMIVEPEGLGAGGSCACSNVEIDRCVS